MMVRLIGAAGLLTMATGLEAFQHPAIQPRPSPNAPDQNNPGGLEGIQATKDVKPVDPEIQKEIRADVEKLFEMSSDLKNEIESGNANSTLSLSVVKKAQQIEKLAKKIKERAKG
jgi:hypothetical protein